MSLSVDTNAVLKANKAKKRRQFMKALFSRKIVREETYFPAGSGR